MEEVHFLALLTYKQQVYTISLSLYYCILISVDANGLQGYILLNSRNDLITEDLSSPNICCICESQIKSTVPSNVDNLWIYSNRNYIIKSIPHCRVFSGIKHLTIGKFCFQHVREFMIDGLESLESVKIGEECFRIDDEEHNDGICRITNCPNLTQLEIGDGSFEDFKSLELFNLNSIQSIKFGDHCFRYAECFSLKGE